MATAGWLANVPPYTDVAGLAKDPATQPQGVAMSSCNGQAPSFVQGPSCLARAAGGAAPTSLRPVGRQRSGWARAALLALGIAHAGAWAQGTASIYDEQAKLVSADGQVAPLKGDLFGDRVSLYSGTLEFVNTDFLIPGNNALPVGVARRHVTGQLRVAAEASVTTGIFGDWDLEIPHLSGVYAGGVANKGWAVLQSGADAYKRCTYFGSPPEGRPSKGLSTWEPSAYSWSGHSLYVPGQGAQTVLLRMAQNLPQPSDGRSWPLLTKNGWQLGCLPTLANGTGYGRTQGEGFLALAPDGTEYRFDWMAERPMPSMVKKPLTYPGTDRLFRIEVWLMPTRITDRFGNTVTLIYDPASPWRVQTITASDGRSVSFSYHPGTQLVSTVTDGLRTWTYSYVGTRLSQVGLPDGSRWTYNLAALAIATQYGVDTSPTCNYAGQVVAAPATGEITHPSGARGVFAMQSRIHGRSKVPESCEYYDGNVANNYSLFPQYFATRSITSKTLFGPGLPAAGLRTDYAYSAANGSWSTCTTCSETKTVEVTDPRGYRTRHTFGTRFGVNDGQLLQIDEGWNGSSAMRSTVNRYRATDAGPYPAWIGDSDQMRKDPLQSEQYSPLDRKVVTQQGVSFTWQANAFDQMARAVSITRSSSLGDSRSETTLFYDHSSKWVLGQVASVIWSGSGLPVENHTYDPTTANRMASYRFGLLQQRFAYYGDGTLQARFDPLNRGTYYGDYRRGLAQWVSYPDGRSQHATVDDLGAITSLTNGAGTTTSFGYDVMGRLNRVTHPGGDGLAYHPTSINFEPVASPEFGLEAGHWRQTVSTGNARTVRYFDALWRPRMTRSWDAANEAGTRRVVQLRWDADGRKTFESYPQRDIGSVDSSAPGTAWAHDALGRVLWQYQDSEIGLLTTRTDYLGGFVRRVINPRGHATHYGFQAFDEPSEQNIRSITAPEGVAVTINRDIFGKALAITRGGAGASVTRSYAYDDHQRLCKTVEPETGATVQAYDGAGNLAWRASGLTLLNTYSCDQASVPASRMVSHGYDARGRLTSTAFGDGSPGITRSYTADGLPLQITSAGATWTYSYNNRRLLVGETLQWGSNYSFWRGVDAYGHPSSLTYPTGLTVHYAPNALGQPTQVSGFASAISHHPNGAVAGYTLANGVAHSVVQNLRGLPQTWRDAGVVQDQYSYDANGNVSAIADLQEANASRYMDYDGLDRLTASSGVWRMGSFTYDALDNLRVSILGQRMLFHNIDAASNRLSSLSGSQSIALAYDANGNLSQRGAQSFAFDIANRLQSAAGKASYSYDGHGRRVFTAYANGSSKLQAYSQDGKLLLSRRLDTGAYTAHVYLGSKLIAEADTSSGVSYSHTDALGSPVARSNAAGQLLSRTRYEPYGATAAGTNPTGIGFTGHVNDTDTGLVYMQQRYYDAVAGRFLSVDPVITNAKDGSFFGRYHYVNNNPYKYTDPDGRASCADKECKTSNIDPQVKRADGGTTKITFVNNDPNGASPNQPIATMTATTIEGVISAANVESVNINSTTGGIHSSKASNHYSGRAIDIDRVDGKPVGANNVGAGRIQEAARPENNIRENYGPHIMEKRSGADRQPTTVKNRELEDAHKSHVHLSTQP